MKRSPPRNREQNSSVRSVRKTQSEITPTRAVKMYNNIILSLKVAPGKLADIVRMVNYFNNKFNHIDVEINITARDGQITATEYEDKIKEAIYQAKVTVEDEKLR